MLHFQKIYYKGEYYCMFNNIIKKMNKHLDSLAEKYHINCEFHSFYKVKELGLAFTIDNKKYIACDNKKYIVLNTSYNLKPKDIVWLKAHEMSHHAPIGCSHTESDLSIESLEIITNVRALSLLNLDSLFDPKRDARMKHKRKIIRALGYPDIVYEWILFLSQGRIIGDGYTRRLRKAEAKWRKSLSKI